ncbi:MAG: phosphoenolpyruvate carboxykinase (GTP), partial [Clostridia bacterium]|nr:phosphoenolpyruvate carboxykinase (GTP) [Clostridia bacterium]
PYADDINLEGIEDEVSREALESILDVEPELWKEEAAGIEEYYAQFGDKLPPVLKEQLENLKAAL